MLRGWMLSANLAHTQCSFRRYQRIHVYIYFTMFDVVVCVKLMIIRGNSLVCGIHMGPK